MFLLARAPTTLCPNAQWNSTFTLEAGGTGTAGSTSNLFSSPYDVTIDIYQNLYVVDYNNHRIQRFPAGLSHFSIHCHPHSSLIGSNIGATVAGFSLGSGPSRSELYNPTAIYVDLTGSMYILDSLNYRVLFWRAGDPLGTIIINGRGSGTTFDRIGRSYAMFIDGQQNIYVSENANNRVTKWFYGNNTISLLVRPKSQDETEFESMPCVGGWREWCR